jgi:hypothetical protein
MSLVRIYFFAVAFLFLISCKTSKPEVQKDALTYAEISIKEGGTWNGQKYEGGTFVNQQKLVVPEQHTDHSYFIRYEGPGWESNIIGYRLYLDWRNAIDIFGKLTEERVLPQVGQDGFDSYHEMSDWGADILKVGKGLGIGSIGRYVNGEVLHFKEVEQTTAEVQNHKDFSRVQVSYQGWKTNNETTNLSSQLTIFPNQRYTEHTIQSSYALEGICTGIVNLYNLPYVQKQESGQSWGYIATYGKQTLFDDHLGMAILYKVAEVDSIFTGPHDHLIQFKPSTQKITFYFLGAWEKEPQALKTEAEFYAYLDSILLQLNKNQKLK